MWALSRQRRWVGKVSASCDICQQWIHADCATHAALTVCSYLQTRKLVAIITSKIDSASGEFRANQTAMRVLTAELEERRAKAGEGGPVRARERHLARGKLLARERVMALIDPGAPFLALS